MFRLFSYSVIQLFSYSVIFAQIPVGTWREHLSWNTAEAVAVAGNKVYCSNGVGLCIYDIPSRNLEKLTKVNGLNDAGITALQYAPDINAVAVGYVNGNMDIVAGNNVYNIPYIKRDGKYANKRIHHIFVSGRYAYLSCSFGIVMVDMQLQQIRDTPYIIGDNGDPVDVFSLTEYHGYFYAATAHGLKKADCRSGELPYFSVWEKVEGIPASDDVFKLTASSGNHLYICDMDNRMFVYDGLVWKSLSLPPEIDKIHRLTISGNSLLVSASNGVFIYNTANNLLQKSIQSLNGEPVLAYDAMFDRDGACWIADNRQGLARWRSENDISFYLPNGPTSNHATALRFKADRLLVAGGGQDNSGQPLNRKGEIHTFYANRWSSISEKDAYDFTDVDIAENQPETYYVTSWGGGLYVFEKGGLKDHFTQYNSAGALEDHFGNVLCGGLLMDANHKLWVSNNRKVALFDAGQWKSLSWQATSGMGRLTGDHYGQIWTTQGSAGLLVFSKEASEQGQSGASISFKPLTSVTSEYIDKSNQVANTPDGIIWVATTQGPVYYRNPSVILKGEGTGGTHPIRTGTDEPSRLYALLGSENILSVAIDGAYRKWFGTKTAGVFLIAEDNVSETKRFTADNSPLFSNAVHDIAINDKTGEVFFATEYGILSYRSDAVSSGSDFANVYVFPNPVRPEYHGEITIMGLIKDADVKITDIAGNLVYQTRSLGGQAVWNGRNRQGRRVASGVYLIFCTNDDGSKTHVTKVLFIN